MTAASSTPSARIWRDDVGNVGTPVAHADVDAERDGRVAASSASTRRPCSRVMFGERAAADQRVAVLDLLDDVLRHGAAADHVAQVLGNLLHGLGGSVGEEEDGAA